jgi:hypothetical protein
MNTVPLPPIPGDRPRRASIDVTDVFRISAPSIAAKKRTALRAKGGPMSSVLPSGPTGPGEPSAYLAGAALIWLSTHSVVTLFGLSMGRPRARSQMSWDRTPMARETPKNTV